MRRWVGIVLGVVLVLAMAGWLFVLPAVQREMMREPIMAAIAAVRGGDMPGLRACFTRDATVRVGPLEWPVENFLRLTAEPLSQVGPAGVSLRFGGLSKVSQPSGTAAEADLTVWLDYSGEDSPYRRVPIKREAHVSLQRQGLFTWKIHQLTTEVEALRGLVPGL